MVPRPVPPQSAEPDVGRKAVAQCTGCQTTCSGRRYFVARTLQCAAMFPRAKKGIYKRARAQPVGVGHQEVARRGAQGDHESGDVRVGQVDMARDDSRVLERRDSYTVQPSCGVAEIEQPYLRHVAIRKRAGRGGASLHQSRLTADNLPVRDGCDFSLHGGEVRYQRSDGHSVVIRAVQGCRGAYTFRVLDVESEPHVLKCHDLNLSTSYGVPRNHRSLHLRVSVLLLTPIV